MPRRLDFDNTLGWQAVKGVMIDGKKKDVTKFFSDTKYGYDDGYKAALSKEKEWSKSLKGVKNRSSFRTKPLINNKSTGIVGISAGKHFDKRKNSYYWNIQTFFKKNKKVMHSSFSIEKYGLTKALRLAIEERCKQMYGNRELKKLKNGDFGSSETFFNDRLFHIKKYLSSKGLTSIRL